MANDSKKQMLEMDAVSIMLCAGNIPQTMESIQHTVSFEALTVVTMKCTALLVVIPCSSEKV
jgi:hypothetical protein